MNDGFHFLEIHSLPEKMMWPGMFLFLLFILVIIYTATHAEHPLFFPGTILGLKRSRDARGAHISRPFETKLCLPGASLCRSSTPITPSSFAGVLCTGPVYLLHYEEPGGVTPH